MVHAVLEVSEWHILRHLAPSTRKEYYSKSWTGHKSSKGLWGHEPKALERAMQGNYNQLKGIRECHCRNCFVMIHCEEGNLVALSSGSPCYPLRCMFTIAARVATISNWFSILTLLQITASSSLYIDSRQDLNPADMETLRIRIGCMSLWVLHSMIALNCQSLAIPVNVSIPCHWMYAVSSEPRQNP